MPSVGRDMKELTLFNVSGRGKKWCSHSGKHLAFAEKTLRYIYYMIQSSHPYLPKSNESYVHIKTQTQMFTTDFFLASPEDTLINFREKGRERERNIDVRE